MISIYPSFSSSLDDDFSDFNEPFLSMEDDHRSTTIAKTTDMVLADLKVGSKLFNNDSMSSGNKSSLPRLDVHEVQVGKILGRGDFGEVLEVVSLTGLPSPQASHSDCPASPIVQRAASDAFTAPTPNNRGCPAGLPLGSWQDCTRYSQSSSNDVTSNSGEEEETQRSASPVPPENETGGGGGGGGADATRYAIKRVCVQKQRDDAVPESKRLEAGLDLACEAAYLSVLDHPNCIGIYATVGAPGRDAFYGIVLDRLVVNLEEKIDQWRQTRARLRRTIFCARKRKGSARAALFHSRLAACRDVASALSYMHGKSLLFRDLKPANVGEDMDGILKVFDFGLAKELKPVDLIEPPNGYEATGLTGSRRYMAPEVMRCEPYGFPADVYSFGILAWQVLSLKTPFKSSKNSGEDSRQQHYEHVVLRGKRPRTPLRRVPSTINKLMEDCWDEDPSRRPSAEQVSCLLQDEIASFDRKSNEACPCHDCQGLKQQPHNNNETAGPAILL